MTKIEKLLQENFKEEVTMLDYNSFIGQFLEELSN